jgi:cytochrome c5
MGALAIIRRLCRAVPRRASNNDFALPATLVGPATEEFMSDAHRHAEEHAHDGPHEGPIKTPKQLIWAVAASFIVPIILIIMLTQFVATGEKEAAGTSALEAEAVAKRIHPVSSVEVKDLNDVATLKTGEQVFQAQCSACHTTGAAGAPKFGDEAAWAPRIKNGFEALLNSALKGKGNMGPQGGGDFSDLEIARAVVYMANKGGAKFDEPKAPAAAASAAQ